MEISRNRSRAFLLLHHHHQLLPLLVLLSAVSPEWHLHQYCCIALQQQPRNPLTPPPLPPPNKATSRRDWLLLSSSSSAAVLLATAHPWPVAAVAEDAKNDNGDYDPHLFAALEQQCRNGALAPEQAIPGAYQQVCMNLPTRTIPIHRYDSRSSDNNSSNNNSSTTPTIVELELEQQATGPGSTGTVVWNSSLLLTRLLERLVATGSLSLSGKTVLELGCGTGLTSLTAAVLGAPRVVATDGNPNVVELAQDNIVRNQSKLPPDSRVTALPLPWGLLAALDFAETADLVLGSDLTYYSGNWPALAETMATLVKRRNGMVLYLSLGHSGFNPNAELEGFLSVASGYGLASVQVGQAENNGFLSERYMTNLLWNDCLTVEERELVASSGGVRVLALMRKY